MEPFSSTADVRARDEDLNPRFEGRAT